MIEYLGYDFYKKVYNKFLLFINILLLEHVETEYISDIIKYDDMTFYKLEVSDKVAGWTAFYK